MQLWIASRYFLHAQVPGTRGGVFLIIPGVSGCQLRSVRTGSGEVRGTVVDPSGAALPGATVEITNPVSGYSRTAATDSQGRFTIANVPLNNYHVTASAHGFKRTAQDVNVRSGVPVDIKVALQLGSQSSTVTVEAGSDLVETDPTTHTDVDRALFNKLPLESASSSLSSLVTLASPGVAADSNGLFHGLGDHAQNSFSVDGQPITDQQSKVFSNQLPVEAVQSMQVIEGAPPAEYGDKTSLVVVVNTRSGLGVTEPHGDVTSVVWHFRDGECGVLTCPMAVRSGEISLQPAGCRPDASSIRRSSPLCMTRAMKKTSLTAWTLNRQIRIRSA